jgi:hypothetical protein
MEKTIFFYLFNLSHKRSRLDYIDNLIAGAVILNKKSMDTFFNIKTKSKYFFWKSYATKTQISLRSFLN